MFPTSRRVQRITSQSNNGKSDTQLFNIVVIPLSAFAKLSWYWLYIGGNNIMIKRISYIIAYIQTYYKLEMDRFFYTFLSKYTLKHNNDGK